MNKKFMIIIFLAASINNNANANWKENIKDNSIGLVAGITSSFVIHCLRSVSPKNKSIIQVASGLTTALITLRTFKERKDINSLNCLSCILTNAILLTTGIWNKIIPVKNSTYSSDLDSDEDDENYE